MSKAFDIVLHNVLLARLAPLGFETSACQLFHSGPTGRTGAEAGHKSGFFEVTKEVARSSLLSPILFL